MFRRQNTSKPVSGKLLRIVYESDKFSDVVYNLSNHPFMDKLVTPAQRKNGTDRDLIIQTLMLISTDSENDFTSFRNKAMDIFVQYHSDDTLDKADVLKDAMDSFNNAFEKVKIPITSIPMVLYSGYAVKKGKKSFAKLVDIVNEFLNGYDTNEDYKKYVISGTSGQENVKGRFGWWKDKIKSA